MRPDDQESRLRTWVEGYGQFGGQSNPDVSLSNNVGGQFQHSATSASPSEVAEDFKRYLIAKGINSLTPQRFQLILRSKGWLKYFDPFMSSCSQSSVVFRTSWEDSWEVFRLEDSAKWTVRKFGLDPTNKYDGWKLVLPNLYLEYAKECSSSNRHAVEESEFIKNWLTCGLINLRDEIQWIYLFSGPSERDRWLSLFNDVDVLKKWLTTGLIAKEAKTLSELGFDQYAEYFISSIFDLDLIAEWTKSGFENKIILEFQKNNITLKAAEAWRSHNVVPLPEVLIWNSHGFDCPNEVKEWKAIGFDARSASSWKNFNFSPTPDVGVWFGLINRPDIARFLLDRGFKVLEAERFQRKVLMVHHESSDKILEQGDMRRLQDLPFDVATEVLNVWLVTKIAVQEIVKWHNSGLDESEYLKWIYQDMKLQTAMRYRKYNFGPRQSGELFRKKISPSQAIEQGIVPNGA